MTKSEFQYSTALSGADDHLSLSLEALASIISFSDWKTIAAWRATSRTSFRQVALHLRRRYHDHIRPFVTDVCTFDDTLRSHGGVISGTVALHFFVPDITWSPREMDIYIPFNSYRSFLSTITNPDGLGWVRVPGFRSKAHTTSMYPSVFRFNGGGVEETEYIIDDFLSPEDAANYVRPHSPCPCGREHLHPLDDLTGNHHVANQDEQDEDTSGDEIISDSDEGDGEFFRADDGDLTDAFVQLEFYTPELPSLVHGKGFPTMRSFRTTSHRRVNVISSYSSSPITPLRYFWASLMTNFLTPDGCVCSAPSATLQRRGAIRVDPLSIREDAALEEYERRGFTFSPTYRNDLDLWDYLFFGEQRLLALDFRTAVDESPRRLPITRTDRGWIADDSWRPAALRKSLNQHTHLPAPSHRSCRYCDHQ